MDCKKAGQYMMEYVEGSISQKHLYDLKIHIKNCENCKNEFEFYENFKGVESDFSKSLNNDNIMSRVRDSNSFKIVPKDFSLESYFVFLYISIFFGAVFLLLAFYEPLSLFFTNKNLVVPKIILNILNDCVYYINVIFLFLYYAAMKLSRYIKILILIFVFYGILGYFIKKK